MGDEFNREECFQAAARRLCARWESLDYGVPEDSKYLEQYRELLPNDAVDSFRRQLDEQGALATVQTHLKTRVFDGLFAQLEEKRRLDLSLEALCTRPAWRNLFTEDEKEMAARILIRALSNQQAGDPPPTIQGRLEDVLEWLNESLLFSELDDSSSTRFRELGRTSCDSLREAAQDLTETGLLRLSPSSCVHFRNCHNCAAEFAYLTPLVNRIDERQVELWSNKVFALVQCLSFNQERKDRVSQANIDKKDMTTAVQSLLGIYSDPQYSAKAWRAIVCASGIDLPNIDQLLDMPPHLPMRKFADNLTNHQIQAVFFTATCRKVFVDLQINLFEPDPLSGCVSIPHVVLPTDGDLSTLPGIVEAVPSKEYDEWWSLMTNSAEPLNIDSFELFNALWDIASLNHHPRGTSREAHCMDKIEAEIGGVNSAVSEVRDLVESLCAGQVPLIDALQAMVKRSGESSKYKAEESIKEILGAGVYSALSAKARTALIEAEYNWLDPDYPNPSTVLHHLGTAVERQIKYGILQRFCDQLTASGTQQYPETPLVRSHGMTNGHPNTSSLALLNRGHMNHRLNLNDMARLFDEERPPLAKFLQQSGLDSQSLARLCGKVARTRNPATHAGGFTQEEVHDIRCEWLGLRNPGTCLFSQLILHR